VTASDKTSGNVESITINAQKGRLSEEEIKRLVEEAKEHEEEDKLRKEKIQARNSLESYVYQIKNTISDKDKLGGKIEEDDKQAIEDAIKETIEWLDDNNDETKEVYDEKYKELEEIVNPIFAKLYQSGAAHPPGDEEEMPSHDEL